MSQSRLENEDTHAESLIQHGNDEAVSLLQKKSEMQPAEFISPTSGEKQVFFIMYGRTKQLKADFKKFPPNNNANYLLSIAVTHGRPDIVTLLLEDYKIPFATPAFKAAWNGSIPYFKILEKMLTTPDQIEFVKAALLQADKDGMQPIHYAIASGNVATATLIFNIMQTLESKHIPDVYNQLAYLPLVALSSRQLACFSIFMNTVDDECMLEALIFPENCGTFGDYTNLLLHTAIRFNSNPLDVIFQLIDSITIATCRHDWADGLMLAAYESDYFDIFKAIAIKYTLKNEASITKMLTDKQKNNPFYYQLVNLCDKRELGKNINSLTKQYADHQGSANDYYCLSGLAFLAKEPKQFRKFYLQFLATRPTNDWFERAAAAITLKIAVLFEHLTIETTPSFSDLYQDHFFEVTNASSSYFHALFDALLFRSNVTIPADISANKLWEEFNSIPIPQMTLANDEDISMRIHKRCVLIFSINQMIEFTDGLIKMTIGSADTYNRNIKNLTKHPTAERIRDTENVIVFYSIINNLISFLNALYKLTTNNTLNTVMDEGEIKRLHKLVAEAKQVLQKKGETKTQQTTQAKNDSLPKKEIEGKKDKDKEKRRKLAEENAKSKAAVKQAAKDASKAAEKARKEEKKAQEAQRQEERRLEKEESNSKNAAKELLAQQQAEENAEKEHLKKAARELKKLENKTRKKAEKSTKKTSTSTYAEVPVSDKEEATIPSIATNTSTITTTNKRTTIADNILTSAQHAQTAVGLKHNTSVWDTMKNAASILFSGKKPKATSAIQLTNQLSSVPVITKILQRPATSLATIEAAPALPVPNLMPTTIKPISTPPAPPSLNHTPTIFVPIYIHVPVPVAVPSFIPKPVPLTGSIQTFGHLNKLSDAIINLFERFEGRIAIAGDFALSIQLNLERPARCKIILLADPEEALQTLTKAIKKERDGFTHLFIETDSMNIDIKLFPLNQFKTLQDAMQADSNSCPITAFCIYLVIAQLGFRPIMLNNAKNDIPNKILKLVDESLPLNYFLDNPDEYIYLLYFKYKYRFNNSERLNGYIDHVKANEDLLLQSFKLDKLAIQRAFSELVINLSYATGHNIIEEHNLRRPLLEAGVFNEVELTYFSDEANRNSTRPLALNRT